VEDHLALSRSTAGCGFTMRCGAPSGSSGGVFVTARGDCRLVAFSSSTSGNGSRRGRCQLGSAAADRACFAASMTPSRAVSGVLPVLVEVASSVGWVRRVASTSLRDGRQPARDQRRHGRLPVPGWRFGLGGGADPGQDGCLRVIEGPVHGDMVVPAQRAEHKPQTTRGAAPAADMPPE